jgi:hypothetical protein
MNRISVVWLALGAAACLAFSSAPHSQPAAKPPNSAPLAALGPDCEIAAVNPDHAFVAAAVYGGDTLTNLQLKTADNETTLVRVKVAPGARPITVLLQAEQAVIWDFEGAVERVARAIVVPNSKGQAATRGLSAQQTDFLKLTGCPQQSIPMKRDPDNQRDGILRLYFGRAPDRIASEEAPNALALPDASFGSSPGSRRERTAGTQAEQDLLHYFPGGFRVIDPGSVMSTAEVLAPETYPLEAGLIQLERAGAIRPPGSAETDTFVEGISRPYRSRLSPDFRFRMGFSYVVTRDMAMPSGLAGAHSKSFLVLPGVPVPRGKKGHGCLAFMDGFRINDDLGDMIACYGDNREAMEQLKKMPDAEAAKSCRLFEPQAATAIEAVSIYQPETADQAGASKRIPQPVDVAVSKAGAVLLVLSSYEPAIWRVSPGANTRIAGVILTGFYSSKVEGLDPDTPIFPVELRSRQNRPASGSACAPLYDYLGTSYDGGPAAIVLNRQINALTGRDVDAIRGGSALRQVEVK